jgi:hypothetical protein
LATPNLGHRWWFGHPKAQKIKKKKKKKFEEEGGGRGASVAADDGFVGVHTQLKTQTHKHFRSTKIALHRPSSYASARFAF